MIKKKGKHEAEKDEEEEEGSEGRLTRKSSLVRTENRRR